MSTYLDKLRTLFNLNIRSTPEKHSRQIREDIVRQTFPDLSLKDQLVIADQTEITDIQRQIHKTFPPNALSGSDEDRLARVIAETLRDVEAEKFDKRSDNSGPA